MNILKTNEFEKAFAKLQPDVQRLYNEQERRFQDNHRDQRLHVKQLRGELPNIFSLRVTHRYRVLYYFQDRDNAVFFDIDHRRDVYR